MQCSRLLLPVSFLALAAAPVTAPIAFEEIAGKAGLHFVTHSSPTPNKNQPETMVAGVGILDYDGDGFPDIYLVNGAAIPSLEKEGPQYHNRLFRNNGDMTFTDVTDKAGVAGKGYGMGVAVGDYDNDGRPDLFLANVTGNQLFHNNGDGTFTDVTARAGVGGALYAGRKMWSVAAAWVDYNNDGLLDLFVSNYCQWEVNRDPVCLAGNLRVYCDPKYYKPLPNTLYRNNGDGTFTDVSEQTGISRYLGRGMGVSIADYDGDGYMDIFVANDNAPNQLFHNIQGQRFEEVALDAGVAYSEAGNVISGMGAEFRDVMNRGMPDIWITAIEYETFPLFLNHGRGQFIDDTSAAGLTLETAQMSGWSNGIADLDNDGWKDLFVARSNVERDVALYSKRQYPEPNAVFRNLGNGRFQNVSGTAGDAFQTAAPHRGMAFADLDNDGRMDVVVSVLNGPAKLFHNTTRNSNHWLLLKLIGTTSNRMGIGARVRLTTEDGRVQYDHLTTSTGYACSSDSRMHFGLGSSPSAKEIEVVWPSGTRQVVKDVAADRIVTVTEPRRASRAVTSAEGLAARTRR